jgi:hypothetical protein
VVKPLCCESRPNRLSGWLNSGCSVRSLWVRMMLLSLWQRVNSRRSLGRRIQVTGIGMGECVCVCVCVRESVRVCLPSRTCACTCSCTHDIPEPELDSLFHDCGADR